MVYEERDGEREKEDRNSTSRSLLPKWREASKEGEHENHCDEMSVHSQRLLSGSPLLARSLSFHPETHTPCHTLYTLTQQE